MTDHNLAYLDREFLESEEARSIRILAEYFEPLRRFKAQKIQDTVVFFGSARIKGRAHAEAALARLQQRHQAAESRAKKNGGRNGKNGGRGAGGGGSRSAAATVTASRRTTSNPAEYAAALKRAKRAVESSRFYEDARRLAHLLTTWTLTLDSPNSRFVVCSGGGPGIMEAANRGALEAGGKSIGLNINLPFEQGLNRYTTDGLGFEFHYFFMRKFWFAYLAKALVIFPGGFGTMDEMFEILTLAQTQKLSKELRVILYGGEDYWDEILKLDPMVEWGMISPEDRHLLYRVNDPEEAFEYLRDHLTRYHLVPETAQEQKTPGIAKTRKLEAGR
jgi:uncharacterized protein (TIGR00730 family)